MAPRGSEAMEGNVVETQTAPVNQSAIVNQTTVDMTLTENTEKCKWIGPRMRKRKR